MKRKKHMAAQIPFDPTIQIPILKCSICTGEQVAGFKNIESRKFTEVMVIRSNSDLEHFRNTYKIDGEIKKEY